MTTPTTPNAPKAAAPAVAEAELEPMQSDWPIGRAAEMLTAYAELVKATGRYAEEHYIPEVEHVISELRLASVATLAAAPQQVAAWMPIQTAPKYKEVLLWREDAGSFTGIFTSAEQFLSDRDQAQLTIEELEVEDWFGGDYVGSWRLDGDEKPTHWQPLPAPPSQASATGEV